MSAVPEVKVETCKNTITDSTDTTTTTTTPTTNSNTTTENTTTTTTTATEAASGNKEKDSTENSVPLCIKPENPRNEQFHPDSSMNSAIPATEKSSPGVTEEKKNLMQSSNSAAVTGDGAVADNVNIDKPEVDALSTSGTENTTGITASEGTLLRDSANSFDQNKDGSFEHNLKGASDQTLKPKVTTPVDSPLPESQINATDAIIEQSDVAFTPSSGENEENYVKDETVRGIDEGMEKEDSDSEGDFKTQERSTSLADKEASSDETDHFVDAKSYTQMDGASGDDAVEIGEEAKEQTEEIQDEEGYEYDEEEQETGPDDDEVEGNPAFIPKSGRYYMHDSRNTDEERIPEPSPHSRADGKWKHDRFDERSQRPKTKRELMNRYGYDIRNEAKNTAGTGLNASPPQSNQTRDTSKGSSGNGNYGNRGRHSNQALLHHPQHQSYDRRDRRRPIQNSGTGRPANRGSRKTEHHVNTNQRRDQHGTRVFKNSPANTQKGTTNRTDNNRTYDRSDEYLRDNRQNSGGGGNKGRGGRAGVSGGDTSITYGKGGGTHTGGKRYSTQRVATNYTPNVQQPPLPQPPPPLQSAPTTGPIPIPPPDWRPPAYQGPPPPSTVPPPPPPAIAIPAQVPNFRPSDIVYFDPQPQQLFRGNPIPPRTKKRLEIVPPYQGKNSN